MIFCKENFWWVFTFVNAMQFLQLMITHIRDKNSSTVSLSKYLFSEQDKKVRWFPENANVVGIS